MIEIIVVMVILAIAAGLIAPRFFGNDQRRAQADAESLRGLLTAAAELHADLGSRGVFAVDYDPQARRVSLLRRTAAAKKGEWDFEPDRLLAPVDLERLAVAQMVLDGRVQTIKPEKGWRIEFDPSRPRPAVSLLLSMSAAGPSTPSSTVARDAQVWQIDLLGEQPSAALRERPAGTSTADAMLGASESVDLDTAGAGDTPW